MAVTGYTERMPRRTISPLDLLYRPEVRQILFQVILIVAIGALFWMIVSNTAANLRRQNIASGFGFWNTTSGFDISQSLIEYSNTSTYGRAFWVGFWNTIVVAVIGVVFATVAGFTMGIARLSSNWLVARLATVYIETIRNIPLLLQLFVWYFAVLKTVPPPRQSLALPGGASLNLRGLYLPEPIPKTGFDAVLAALAVGILAAITVAYWARRRQLLTGAQFHTGLTAFGLIVVLPIAVADAVQSRSPPYSSPSHFTPRTRPGSRIAQIRSPRMWKRRSLVATGASIFSPTGLVGRIVCRPCSRDC